MQENLLEAERRIEEARGTQIESLDLGDLALSELPASLGDLPRLRGLYLGTQRPIAGGSLEWTDSRESPEFKDLSPLAGLIGLQSLNLGSCSGVVDLSSLAGLQGLQVLGLEDTGVTDLSPLAGLQSLQTLNLTATPVIDFLPLSSFKALQRLDLEECHITDLSPLSGLQELKVLGLQYCRGVRDLSPLSSLQGLQCLDLFSCLFVTDLWPLSGLRVLQRLNLRDCLSVTDLAALAGLPELESLDLGWCWNVTDLSPLTGLQRLQSLSLDGCRHAVPVMLIRSLAELPRLTELFADQAVGVPREVLSRHSFDNCLPRLRAYFSELALGAEAENEVKLILLGNGRVGKTQLCRRFRGQPFDESIESTHGVKLWREQLRLQTGGQEQVFQVNWWDFGGQDIYHGTHALFLRSRAVFLILWTPALENRDEYTENGSPLRNQPLSYWLSYVRTLAGRGSPVIVVQSQCDRFTDRRPDPERPDGFEFFECCSYSAKEDLDRDILQGQLRKAIRYLLERSGTLEIGHGRAEVRRRLHGRRTEDQERQPEERRNRTLTPDEFRTICEEVGDIVSWEHALDYFHQTGVVFYQPELFSDCIVLDQDWALDAIYAVFHRGRAIPWLRDSGRFTREDLALTVWQKHSLEEQNLFLGLMESCGVCFPCGETAQGETRYIAPDLLPRFEVVAGRLYAWKEDATTPTLRLEYRFFHPAVIRSLMSQIGGEAEDLAEYWKYGLWLKDGRRDTQLLVQLVDTSTERMPGAGALELQAQGRDPLGLLREIRQAILWQRIGEEPEEMLTLEGTTVARSALATVIDGRVLDVQGKPVSAVAYSSFFADRKHGTGENPEIDIRPQALSASEKPSVFISYSRKDTRSLEALRVMLAPLVRNSVVNVWWDGEIKPSQLWREEIDKALASARIGVLLVSPDFLASDFIAREELPYLVEAAGQRRVELIWVLLSPCLYEQTPLGAIQAAHDLSRPLDSLRKPARIAVLKKVCQRIAEAAAAQAPA